MDAQGTECEDNTSLEHQMKNLLKKIEAESVPDELKALAQELQAAIKRQHGSSDPQD